MHFLLLTYCHTFSRILIVEVIGMPRTGRPKVDNPKYIKYSIRLDEYMEDRLIDYCVKWGITKGEAIRRAIELLLSGGKR